MSPGWAMLLSAQAGKSKLPDPAGCADTAPGLGSAEAAQAWREDPQLRGHCLCFQKMHAVLPGTAKDYSFQGWNLVKFFWPSWSLICREYIWTKRILRTLRSSIGLLLSIASLPAPVRATLLPRLSCCCHRWCTWIGPPNPTFFIFAFLIFYFLYFLFILR